MKNDEKRFSLQCTKNTTKICISIQNFNNAKKIQKNGELLKYTKISCCFCEKSQNDASQNAQKGDPKKSFFVQNAQIFKKSG